MPMSDADLVRATLQGETRAFDQLVRRFTARIRAACVARVGRRGPADDLVQETFLRGFRALPSLAEADKFASWLYGIAVRTCLDWLKARARGEAPLSELDADAPAAIHPSPRPPLALEQSERRERVLDEVMQLPEIYREVVVLFYYDKRSYQEMGELLGITAAAVNVRLTKARAMLRERLAPILES